VGLIIVYRRLARQLGGEPAYAISIIEKLASGDLTAPIDLKTDDRSSILFSMRAMRDNLANLVSEVRSGTDAIATSSLQIASGNHDLSGRTEQQAASLEKTASSMQEMTNSVKEYVQNAQQANGLVESASSIAIKGGEVVSRVVEKMGAIDSSAKKIVEIISVIDGIAFQTNILALNAAVEAARAGELGRGFAVVATEVRSLAQRSAGAAKEIKTLITDSAEQVASGSKLVTEAGATMDEIVASVKRVNDIMMEIANAGREQSVGIEQINEAIGQVDQVTQQNAALVEEVSAASESLQEQAIKLTEMVRQFKVNDSGKGMPELQSLPPAPKKNKPVANPRLEKPRAPALPDRISATKSTTPNLCHPASRLQ
jgi:methyl-accepting chemotaxis protein